MIYEDLNLLPKKIPTIIIGSGPAGIATALTLEKKGHSSLILEAGNFSQNEDDLNFLRVQNYGDKYADLEFARLRQFGGTSGNWGGNCSVFSKTEIEEWGIDYEDFQKNYEDAKKILNINKDFYIEKLSPKLNFFNVIWSNVQFGKKYKNYLIKSKTIHLALNTTFDHFTGEDGMISSAICINKNNTAPIIGNNYILSCGGIENSRLLLISKKRNKKLFPFEDAPIGNYYFDHPKREVGKGILNVFNFNKFIKNNLISNKPNLDCENLNFSFNHDFLQKIKIYNSAFFLRIKREVFKTEILKNINILKCIAPKYVGRLFEKNNQNDLVEFNLSIFQEQNSVKENRITLSDLHDKNKMEKSKVYWKLSKSFFNDAKVAINTLSDYFIKNDIGRIAISDIFLGGKPKMTVGNHQMGGTRIGKSANESVVDTNLCVHGFRNLYINGSSVFKNGGVCFPTFTIVQLACRLGQYLSKKYEA